MDTGSWVTTTTKKSYAAAAKTMGISILGRNSGRGECGRGDAMQRPLERVNMLRYGSLVCLSNLSHAAIDAEFRTGDEAAFVAREKQGGGRDLFGPAESAQRNEQHVYASP